MMILLGILIWYSLGVAGMAITFWALNYQNGEDIDVSDVAFSLGMAIFGPFSLVAGLVFGVGAFVKWFVNRTGIDWRKPVIRGKHRS